MLVKFLSRTEYITRLSATLRQSRDEVSDFSSNYYSSGESVDLLVRRWTKLEKDFKLKDDSFDLSKLPDIYDCKRRARRRHYVREIFACRTITGIKFDSLHRALKVPFAQDFFLVGVALVARRIKHIKSRVHTCAQVSKSLADIVVPLE